MLDLFNIAKPQGCDIQKFTGAAPYSGSVVTQYSWVKPRGVSHVYMMLIGAGGENNFGASTEGGGSGAVTVWYGAAQHVPDNLVISIPVRQSPTATQVIYRAKTDTVLLSADGGVNNSAGSAMTANQFTASGFFQSVAGQDGTNTNIGASATTFLCGGGGVAATTATGNYGYATGTGNKGGGYFQLQPIIVGSPAAGAGTSTSGVAGIGCGGAGSSTATLYGGPGMVLIASW